MSAAERGSPLDELDSKIVEGFRSDGRLSNAEVARSIGVSEATVRRRVQRLVTRRVLKFVAITNPRALGFEVETLIGLNVEIGDLERVGRELSTLTEVRFLGLAMGALDILVVARFASLDDWLTFRSSKLAQIQGIVRVETFQIVKVMKRTYDWIFEGKDEPADAKSSYPASRAGSGRRSSAKHASGRKRIRRVIVRSG